MTTITQTEKKRGYPMQKIKNRKWILVTLVILAIIVISIIAANIIIVSIAKSNSSRNANLLQNGPWGDEGLWKDSDSTFYLISTNKDSNSYAEVTAYIWVNGKWESLGAHLRQSSNVVSFENTEGNVQITAKANLNNQTLTLSDIESNENFDSVDDKEWVLTKYTWDEHGEQLPFDVH